MKSSQVRNALYAALFACVPLIHAGAAKAQSFDLSLYRARPVKDFFAQTQLVDSPFESAAQQAASQQTTSARSQTGTTTTITTTHATGTQTTTTTTEEGQKTSKDRLFYFLPNFLTLEESQNVAPLTWKEKYAVTARGVIDPSEFVLVGFVALIGQATNDNPTYGQGMEGYAKRYGTAYADNAIENMLASAVLPSLLHQDPRYFQLGHGSTGARIWHAVSRVAITRSDSGTHEFNFSEIGGALGAAAISTYTYHPDSERGFSNVISVWGTQIGWDMATYVLKEFWPDIRRRAHKTQMDRDRDAATAPAATTTTSTAPPGTPPPAPKFF
jgi:hypothetical protein